MSQLVLRPRWNFDFTATSRFDAEADPTCIGFGSIINLCVYVGFEALQLHLFELFLISQLHIVPSDSAKLKPYYISD